MFEVVMIYLKNKLLQKTQNCRHNTTADKSINTVQKRRALLAFSFAIDG